jgi:hypothetical protein
MIKRTALLRRTRVKRRRTGKPRRGRIVDRDYLAWLHAQPGCVYGGKTHSVHHLRFCGSPKNDRHALPMERGYHQIQEGGASIEALGKSKFEEFHGLDLEESILRYQRAYLSEHPGVQW